MYSERELQKAASRALCARLEARGDARTAVREIDHWAYFPSPDARARYVEAAVAAGLRLRGTSEPMGPWENFGAQLFHLDVPSEEAMDAVTLMLYDLAENAGGDYDGWETNVVA